MFRWLALAVFLGALTISGFHRTRAHRASGRIERRRESGLLILGRLLVALPLFGAILVYVANPRWMAWASWAAPAWLRWLGGGLGVLAVVSVHWVLASLGSNVSETVLLKQQHELVTHGPYRWVRHPLYTTGITLFLAIGLIAANWFILLFALLALVSIRLVVVPLEERALLARFGEGYRRYMGTTGAMLPRWATG